jgi:hypothetical protein
MSIHIAQFGKHRFVCGLFWQSLSRPRELRKEAVELARHIDLDLMVLRREHGSAQAGFANTAEGAQRGMASLAAAIAQTITSKGIVVEGRQQAAHNWLGAFKLPDGKWAYFAMRDENFLPNGDFAGTKEEVLERLHGDYGLGGWNLIIGDKELADQGFHNFLAESIENLMPRRGKGRIKVQRSWLLEPVDPKARWKRFALAGLAVCAVAAVAAAGWTYHKHKKDEEERARALELARRQIGAGGSQAPHPWRQKPLPEALARACIDKFVHLAPGGWSLDEYVCDASQSRYVWSRGNSNVEYLLQDRPGAVVELSGDKASYWEPVQLTGGHDDTLQPSKEILMPLLARFQAIGLSVKVAALPPPPTPPEAEKNPALVPDWQTFSLAVGAQGVPPVEIAAMFTEPGIRLEKLSYRGGEWLIEGVVYAK